MDKPVEQACGPGKVFHFHYPCSTVAFLTHWSSASGHFPLRCSTSISDPSSFSTAELLSDNAYLPRWLRPQGANNVAMGYVMVTPSSTVGRRRAGVTRLFLRLAMAVLLLCMAAKSSTAQAPVLLTSLPDSTNGVKDGRDNFFCFRGFQRCRSGIEQCIRLDQECDGVKDCADGSDEGQRCETYDCTAGDRYMCPSGRMCMNVSATYYSTNMRYGFDDPYTMYLCDGVRDCTDGSDEDPSFCKTYDCNANVSHTPLLRQEYWPHPLPAPQRWKCTGGKGGCVIEARLCDGVVNCVSDGGSDESDEFCKQQGCSPSSLSTLFQCQSGRCISREFLCDGKQDCPDGDDEGGKICQQIDCSGSRRRCGGMSNGTCILNRQVCDGVEDCPGGTDEKLCDTTGCPWQLCPSGKECSPNSLCNGVKDCKDGSDEDPDLCRSYNCSYGFKCMDGVTCISRKYLCDGIKNCPDKSDEDPDFCRTRHNCSAVPLAPNPPVLTLKCPGSEYVWCTIVPRLCDGVPDCYNGEEEKPEFCASEEARNLMGSERRITCLSNTTEIINGWFCDGRKDCEDGSDERPAFCELYECPAGNVKCYGKWCMTGKVCDGKRDCPDGSDEKGCTT